MGRHTIFHQYPGALSPALCDTIVAEAEQLAQVDATVNATHRQSTVQLDREVRKTDVAFFADTHWVNGILWHYAARANHDVWQLDIRTCPGAQYGVYRAGGHYTWHQDEFDHPYDRFAAIPMVGFNRKLSVMINLSDPGDYEGGRFQVKSPYGDEVSIDGSEERGSVVVFPSGVVHRAGLVESGERRSLVGWILGPNLR